MTRLTALVALVALLLPVRGVDPDQDRDGPALIASKGYPVEHHYVTTGDGYVLHMLRIPHGLRNQSTGGRAVLLQHGLLDSSDTWVVNFPAQSLGFILADAGFDVWLGNNRGNKYSTNHTHLKPDSREYWDFTWDDMAPDLPAQVEYVAQRTGQATIGYVGHSEGTTQMWANLAAGGNTSVAGRVALFGALAPVAYVDHTMSVVLKAVADLDLDLVLQLFDHKDFLPSTAALRKLLPDVCNSAPKLCDDAVKSIAGWSNASNLNETRWGVYVSHFPSGTSVKNLVHWGQGVRKDRFEMFDYGATGNEQHYHQRQPPQYDLSKIAGVKIASYAGSHDDLGDPTDVNRLLATVPKENLVATVMMDQWGHMDFVWGLDAVAVYSPLVDLLRKYL